jgi:LysM repeat protein
MVGKITFILLLGFILAGCSQDTVTPTPEATSTGMITPYLTVTPSHTSPPADPIATFPVTPVPSPTPFLHTIAEKETMLGIAYQYGVPLEDLQAANPGVDPHFLSVGKTLIIPLSGEIQAAMPTLTPVPVKLGKPSCYRTGDGGISCFVEITNSLEEDVENLSAWVELFQKTVRVLP